MDPVWIKLYGLFPITKRRYVRQLVMTVLLLAALVGLWWYLPMLLPPPERPVPTNLEWLLWGLQNLHWVAAALGGVVLAEAVLTFRAFARAEAARREMINT